MAKSKKRRRKPSGARRPTDAAADRSSGAKGSRPPSPTKRDRADKRSQAQAARAAARRRAGRRELLRRVAAFVAATVGILLLFQLVFRPLAPTAVGASALAAGRAGGCGDIRTPVADAPGGLHLAPGAPYQYKQEPATSGYHDPSPLPDTPKVYTRPVSSIPGPGVVPETRAVHNLEHAYVWIYYRAGGPDALPADVVDALATLTRSEDRVLMAPFETLPAGTSLALAAWNKLWECPKAITADQAAAAARGFIDAYRGTSNAPEAPLKVGL